MEHHIACLNNLCRICGTRYSENTRKPYQCVSYEQQLQSAFGIQINGENREIHPNSFCINCYACMRRHEDRLRCGSSYSSTLSPRQWLPHSDVNCDTCVTHNSKAKGGRPSKKGKQPGRPPKLGNTSQTLGTSALIHEVRVKMQQVPSFRPTKDTILHPSGFVPLPPPLGLRQFTCIICRNVTDQPIELSCHHMFCGECLAVQLQSGNDKCQQPNCANTITLGDIKTPSEIAILSLGALQYRCTKGSCNAVLSLQSLATHSGLCTGQACQPQGSLTPSNISLRHVLSAPVDKTPSTIERRVLGHLTKRTMQSSCNYGTDTTIAVATGGQPMCFRRVTRPRKLSSEVHKKTIRKRTHTISDIRQQVSGRDDKSRSVQMEDELLQTKKEERIVLLKNAGLFSVSGTETLKLKADLGLPWQRIRYLRRWLKQWGLRLESEGAMRRMIGDNVQMDIEAENVPMSKADGSEVQMVPLVQVINLKETIIFLLDKHQRAGQLTWHNGVIPDNEVWVKLGGDKGGGSFKMSFQLCNVERVNSVQNSVVFSIFKAGDNALNLQVALQHYKKQVEEMATTKWQGKSLRFFMFGDYEFLCRMYGLTGANGRHFCLWCEMELSQLKAAPITDKPTPKRTLASIKADCSQFLAAGGNSKEVKFFRNVAYHPFLDIPLSQVCPPSLHLSLGIFSKCFSQLERTCQELDLQLAYNRGGAGVSETRGGKTYKQFVESYRELSNEEERESAQIRQAETKEYLAGLLAVVSAADPESNPIITQLQQDARQQKQKALGVLSSIKERQGRLSFAKIDGPFIRGLDKALSHCGVDRQAYFGGAFVGNHVHKCLQPENVDILTLSLVKTAEAESACSPEVEFLADAFRTLFHRLSKCHHGYSHSRRTTEADIADLASNIQQFLKSYRDMFPGEAITPKMHILENHVIEWLKQWQVGMGFHNEQGGESLHNKFNQLQRQFASVRDPLNQLRLMLKEHHVQIMAAKELMEPPTKISKI